MKHQYTERRFRITFRDPKSGQLHYSTIKTTDAELFEMDPSALTVYYEKRGREFLGLECFEQVPVEISSNPNPSEARQERKPWSMATLLSRLASPAAA